MSTTEEIQQMLDDCEARESKLTEWEAGFIDSISAQFENKGSLSQKQDERLESIWNRVTE